MTSEQSAVTVLPEEQFPFTWNQTAQKAYDNGQQHQESTDHSWEHDCLLATQMTGFFTQMTGFFTQKTGFFTQMTGFSTQNWFLHTNNQLLHTKDRLLHTKMTGFFTQMTGLSPKHWIATKNHKRYSFQTKSVKRFLASIPVVNTGGNKHLT